MTDSDKMFWEVVVDVAGSDPSTLGDAESSAILAADAVIKRCEDVEGLTNLVEYQRGIEEDSSEDIARAVRDYLLGR